MSLNLDQVEIKNKIMNIIIDEIILDSKFISQDKLKMLESIKSRIQRQIDNIEDDLVDQKWKGMEIE